MSELPVPEKQSVDSLGMGIKLFAVFLAELWLYDWHREHSVTFAGAPTNEALWFQAASIVAAIAYPITIAKFKWRNASVCLFMVVWAFAVFATARWAFQFLHFQWPKGGCCCGCPSPTPPAVRGTCFAVAFVGGLVARLILFEQPTPAAEPHQ